MGVYFGMAEYNGQVAGVEIQQLDFAESCSEAEALSESGEVMQIDQYAKKRTISGNGNLKNGSEFALAIGGELTIDGVTYKLNSVSKSYTNTGHVKVSFAGTAPYSAPAE